MKTRTHLVQIALACAVAVAGILIYIRVRWLFYYALMELTFGIVSTYKASEMSNKDMTLNLVALVGATYLVVQGLDNLKQGTDRRRNERSRSKTG